MPERMPSPKTARRRARERDARVGAIMAAAERVFATHGFDLATMEMVADEAELGKATLYYYFRNKQELHARIILEAVSELGERARGALAACGGDPLETVEAISRFAVDFFAGRPHLAKLIGPHMAAGPSALEERLGGSLAKELSHAHAPVMEALAEIGDRLSAKGALTHLLASILIGISTKLVSVMEEPAEVDALRKAAHAELDLFFSLLESPLDRKGGKHVSRTD